MSNSLELFNAPENALFSSIVDDGTIETKVKIFNAINTPINHLSDFIGETIEVVDVIAHPVELVDETTGELVQAVRTILIDKDGVSYDAVSQGVASALGKIFQLIGKPPWTEIPLKMKIKQVKTRNGNNKVNTIELV